MAPKGKCSKFYEFKRKLIDELIDDEKAQLSGLMEIYDSQLDSVAPRPWMRVIAKAATTSGLGC